MNEWMNQQTKASEPFNRSWMKRKDSHSLLHSLVRSGFDATDPENKLTLNILFIFQPQYRLPGRSSRSVYSYLFLYSFIYWDRTKENCDYWNVASYLCWCFIVICSLSLPLWYDVCYYHKGNNMQRYPSFRLYFETSSLARCNWFALHENHKCGFWTWLALLQCVTEQCIN